MRDRWLVIRSEKGVDRDVALFWDRDEAQRYSAWLAGRNVGVLFKVVLT